MMDWSEITDYLQHHGKETIIAVAVFIFFIYLAIQCCPMVEQIFKGFSNVDISSVKDIAK